MMRPRTADVVLSDEIGPGEGVLCHDSFRRAKKLRADEAKSLASSAAPSGSSSSSAPRERPIIFAGAMLVDPLADPLRSTQTCDVICYRGVVRDIVLSGSGGGGARGDDDDDDDAAALPPPVIVDCSGLFLFPGLRDAHVHVTAVVADLTALRAMPPSLMAPRAAVVLGGMLSRGFTCVRDAGGADWGLAQAVDEGTILGPRVLFSGRALSQTGGHGDMRPREDTGGGCACACAAAAGIGRVCDGADAVRLAAREELRLGSHFIKVMASGGVSSPTDALEHPQFSEDELRAASDEAGRRGSYVGAHAYMPSSIARAVACGARSIEHGNYLDAPTARDMAAAGCFLVPTLVTYWAIVEHGAASGFPRALCDKAQGVVDAGAASLIVAREAGVRTCFGSDLLGPMHVHQSREFELRAARGGASPAELLRSATVECAALFALGGGGGGGGPLSSNGRVCVGGPADFCLAAADPRSDLSVLSGGARAIACVVKDGLVAKAPSAAFGDAVNGMAFREG